MTTPTVAKKDTQKLQRSIVDGLEDVKAQDIVVFDTEHLSALFERVIIASGTSNRQTKALAASVRDAVREAGFPKPRIEGEGNGEWIIVDCAQIVVHIMQPSFRQYYHLEELWGEKPVRLKLGVAKPVVVPAKKAAVAEKPATTLKRSNAAKKGVAEAFPSKAQVKKNEAVQAASERKSAARSAVVKARAPAAKSAAAKSTAAKSPAVKSAAAKSTTAKSPVHQPVAAKKTAAKSVAKPAAKTVVVNAPAKKAAAKSAPAGKAPAKKAPAKKSIGRTA
jgi:ribosome-associated protein